MQYQDRIDVITRATRITAARSRTDHQLALALSIPLAALAALYRQAEPTGELTCDGRGWIAPGPRAFTSSILRYCRQQKRSVGITAIARIGCGVQGRYRPACIDFIKATAWLMAADGVLQLTQTPTSTLYARPSALPMARPTRRLDSHGIVPDAPGMIPATLPLPPLGQLQDGLTRTLAQQICAIQVGPEADSWL